MYVPVPPTKEQVLANYLRRWWWNGGQLHVQPTYRPWPPVVPTHDQQVQVIVADLAKDAELAKMQLCTFLGTPEGQLIATAVEMAIPEPYGLVVKEALTIVCNKQGAGRQAAFGIGALIAVGLFIAVASSAAE